MSAPCSRCKRFHGLTQSACTQCARCGRLGIRPERTACSQCAPATAQRATAPCRICGYLSRNYGGQRCQRCYLYWRRHRVERPSSLDLLGTARLCQAPGCGRVTRHIFKGLCKRCYMRAHRAACPTCQEHLRRDWARRSAARDVQRQQLAQEQAS